MAGLSGGHNVWFTVLHQLRIMKLELQRLQPRDQPLDVREADGKLLGLSKVVVLVTVLLELVELVWGGEILYQGLQ